MLNAIKDLSVSSLSLIGFEVEWHSSRSDKWYQSQGYGFKSHECYCEGQIVRGDHNLTPYNHSKKGPHGVMSNAIKDLSVFSSSPIGFKVEWHSSRLDKWYQSQGQGLESRECHCEGGIVRGAITWLPTTILKTGLCGVMLNAIKDLSVSFSSPIGFEVE